MSRCRDIACALSIVLLYFAGSSYAWDADAPSERSLDEIVLRINEQLQAEYALLEPPPITVGRFRESVEAAIETLAKSEKKDRMLLVKALQRILAEERLPDGFSFHVLSTSASYEKRSLDDDILSKKVVNLSYNLYVPVPVGPAAIQPVRLISLNEQFFILRKKRDLLE